MYQTLRDRFASRGGGTNVINLRYLDKTKGFVIWKFPCCKAFLQSH